MKNSKGFQILIFHEFFQKFREEYFKNKLEISSFSAQIFSHILQPCARRGPFPGPDQRGDALARVKPPIRSQGNSAIAF